MGGVLWICVFASGDLFCCKMLFDFFRIMRLCVYFCCKSAFMDGKSFSNVLLKVGSWVHRFVFEFGAHMRFLPRSCGPS